MSRKRDKQKINTKYLFQFLSAVHTWTFHKSKILYNHLFITSFSKIHIISLLFICKRNWNVVDCLGYLFIIHVVLVSVVEQINLGTYLKKKKNSHTYSICSLYRTAKSRGCKHTKIGCRAVKGQTHTYTTRAHIR